MHQDPHVLNYRHPRPRAEAEGPGICLGHRTDAGPRRSVINVSLTIDQVTVDGAAAATEQVAPGEGGLVVLDGPRRRRGRPGLGGRGVPIRPKPGLVDLTTTW